MGQRLPRFKFGPAGAEWKLRLKPSRNLDRAQSIGLTHYGPRTIEIAAHNSVREVLDTTIHEALHAEWPDLDEHAVARAAPRIAALALYVLQALGLGIIPPDEE